jgi:hypothetical protein
MSFPALVDDSASIVIKGTFNPSIFSPAWLLAQDLVGKAEYAKAKIEAILPELAIFETGWLRCQVTHQDLLVSTKEPEEFERVRDVAVGILHILNHTPIGSLGVNRMSHFAVDSAAEWHAIGDALAPKEPWDGPLVLPGMKSVTIWGARRDNYAGRIQVKVEPSIPVQPYGVYVAYNDHHDLVEVAQQPASRDDLFQPSQEVSSSSDKLSIAIKILTAEWVAIMDSAEKIVRRVWELRGGSHAR